MHRRDDRRPHADHPHDCGMKIRRPGLDRCGQRGAARRERGEIAADAEQSSARRDQHRPHIVALAQFSHAKAELAAKVAVDRVTTVGLTEYDMRKSAIDRAFKSLCCECQTHCVSPSLSASFEISSKLLRRIGFSDSAAGATQA